MLSESVIVSDIDIGDRIRGELGDIDGLINSIKEYGLIQPIILSLDMNAPTKPILIAGGRRLAAIKRLGWKELLHGRDYVWRSEEDDLRRKSVELEENLKRKELTWQEQVKGKQQLMTIMQSIHGAPTPGRTREEEGKQVGFGIRQMASMLGESVGTVSRDLQIATVLGAVPALGNESSKESAFKKLITLVAKVTGKDLAPVTQTVTAMSYRVLVYCDDEASQVALLQELEGRGMKCDPVIV